MLKKYLKPALSMVLGVSCLLAACGEGVEAISHPSLSVLADLNVTPNAQVIPYLLDKEFQARTFSNGELRLSGYLTLGELIPLFVDHGSGVLPEGSKVIASGDPKALSIVQEELDKLGYTYSCTRNVLENKEAEIYFICGIGAEQ